MYPILRRVRAFAAAASACAVIGAASAAAAVVQPTISTDRSCYVVGQAIQLSGQGFAPSRTYVVSVDGVLLGNRTTDSAGNFAIPVHPGGLPAGTAQHIDHIRVTDGTTEAATLFTVTRKAGAQIVTSGTTASSLQARFYVWGFSLGGTPRPVYVHYVAPSGRQQARTFLGQTGGSCGYITTPRRKLFPFSLSPGSWTLQVDTQKSYARHPGGPVTRIKVTIP